MNLFGKHSVRFNFIMNFGLKVASALCAAISYPFVFRVLGAEQVGKVTFANSVLSMLSILATLGIPVYGIRECAKVRDDRELLSKTAHELLLVQLIMTAVSTVVLLVATYFVPKLRSEPELFFIQTCILTFGAFNMEWLFAGMERYGYIALRSAGVKILTLILIFLLIDSEDDYLIYAGLLGLSVMVPCVWNMVAARHFISYRRSKLSYNCKRHIRPVLIFFAQTIAVTVYTSMDSTMLGFIRGDYWVGIYDAAIKVKLILSYFITSLGTVLLPRLANYVHNGEETAFWKEIAKSVEFTALTGIPLMCFFVVMAPECVIFLFGSEFLPSASALRILAPTIFLIGCSNLTGTQLLTPRKNERIVLCSVLIGAGVDLILNLILIPRYAAVGAAIGTLVAEVAVLGVQLYFLRKEIPRLLRMSCSRKIALGTVMACLALSGLKTIPIPSTAMKLFTGAVIYFCVLMITLCLIKEPMICKVIEKIKRDLFRCR